MHIQKISKAVTSALAYLGDSADAYAKGNEAKVIQLIWRAASDLEYGLFLFSLICPEGTSSSWKLPPSKQPETGSLITSVQGLLKEAAKSLEEDDLKDAHKQTWLARGQLLRIHNFFEKKYLKNQKSGQCAPAQ
jgi:hypothetical protein